MKALFVQLFEPFLTGFVASLHKKVGEVGSATDWNFAKAFDGWDKMFDKLLKGLEDKAAQVGPYTSPYLSFLINCYVFRIGNPVSEPPLESSSPSLLPPRTTAAPNPPSNPTHRKMNSR